VRSERIILICLAVSAVIHLLFFSDFLNNDNIKQVTPAKSSIEITLTQAIPKPDSQPKSQAKQKPQTSKPVESTREDSLKKIETTEQTVDNLQDDKPNDTDDITPAELNEEDTSKAQSKQELAETQDTVSIVSAASEAEKLKYLDAIVKHINSHKHYPRRALNRGIQGVINISFDLHSDGSIENLDIANGHRLLMRASEQSINRALPMPERPDELLSLEVIHITTSMKYSIEN